MKYILYAILIYVLYQIIFNLVIPLFRTTRTIKKGFREMHSRMEEQQNQQAGYSQKPSSPEPAPKQKKGDYIDFEEVK